MDIPEGRLEALDDCREYLNEAVAETSEELMDKFFEGEPFTQEEVSTALRASVHDRSLIPLLIGDPSTNYGAQALMIAINKYFPAPTDRIGVQFSGVNTKADEVYTATYDSTRQTNAYVFKTIVDPFVGKFSLIKVTNGILKADSTVYNAERMAEEKIGKLYHVCGKKQIETACVPAGDIGAVAKLNVTGTGDTLCSPLRPITLPGVNFENPCYKMAVKPKTKGEEEKVAAGLYKLAEEDPTVSYYSNDATGEMILAGLGEQHLETVAAKLRTKFGVEIQFSAPKVAYRETIRKKAKVQGRHKKQSGGHGQFGDVWIEFEPCDSEELVFAETIFGGSVPKNYFPAVEKGLQESARQGVLAGYPMVGVKATLTDGSYHPVDSSELAFKTAASLAYKAGIPEASPVLLEPVVTVTAKVPTDNAGDIMGDFNKRRGRVLGMDPEGKKLMVITAEVPESELADFPTVLRSVTRGVGSFETEFARYEEVPSSIAQKIIADSKAE